MNKSCFFLHLNNTSIRVDSTRDFFESAISLVKEGGVFVLEAPDFFYSPLKEKGYLPLKERKYGHIYLLYYKKRLRF